jgi:hypothetical protein
MFVHFRAKVTAHTEKSFGAESAIGRFEQEHFAGLVKKHEERSKKDRIKVRIVLESPKLLRK